MGERTATKATATKRVLIVDDEPVVLKTLGAFFDRFRPGTRTRSPRRNPPPTRSRSCEGSSSISSCWTSSYPPPAVAGSRRKSTSASAYSRASAISV
jgi:hypothetical protein